MTHMFMAGDAGLPGFTQLIGPVSKKGFDRYSRCYEVLVAFLSARCIGLMNVFFTSVPLCNPVYLLFNKMCPDIIDTIKCLGC